MLTSKAERRNEGGKSPPQGEFKIKITDSQITSSIIPTPGATVVCAARIRFAFVSI